MVKPKEKKLKRIKKDLGFEKIKGEEYSYKLEDGTILTFRLDLNHVMKIVGEYNKNGNPIYEFNHGVTYRMKVPEKLKKEVEIRRPSSPPRESTEYIR
ncbi:MAG: hypothetical protein ACE5HW_04820 [Candidatus Methanofastidiosia archaeon]